MKTVSYKSRVALISFIFITIVGSDQWTKVLAKKYLKFAKAKIYWGDFFRLQYAENKGAFLSLGSGMSDEMRFWIFTVAVFIFLLVGIFHLFKRENGLYYSVGLSLILSGGIGNLIDRAMVGSVIDFMNMGIGSLRTGIFNIADVAITTGAIMLIIQEILEKKKEKQQISSESEKPH